MAGEEMIEIKFRLFDGTDLGPNKYHPATTVESLKEIILTQWPQDQTTTNLYFEEYDKMHSPLKQKDKENAPRTINDVKLINAGRILENNKTLAESRVSVGELPGGVITMHVVVRPPLSDKNNEKVQTDSPKNRCACSIL